MNDLNKVFNGADEFLDEVIILAVGSHGEGSYTLPGGYTWTDFESVEVSSTFTTTSNTYSSISLTKEEMAANPTDFILRISYPHISTKYAIDMFATGASTYDLTGQAGSLNVKQIKGYIKKYGTRNLSKTVSVNNGSDIAINSRYEIDIATELGSDYLNRDLIVTAEIYNNSGTGVAGWGEAGFMYSAAGYGVKGSVMGSKIVVQTGSSNLTFTSSGIGNPFGNTANITSAPCRVKVWKVDQYLPSTQSSGDITTIWTGSAGNGVTVDWSGTSYILSQFDAILLEAYSTAGLKSTSLVTPASLLLTPIVLPEFSSQFISVSATESSAVASSSNRTLTGIYGINYK